MLGLPAQSRVQPPSRNSTLNSQRSSNPFAPSNEPDWVITPKSSIHQDLLSRETDTEVAESGEKRIFPRQNDKRKTPPSNAKYSSSREPTSEHAESGITASLASSVSSPSRVLLGKAPPIHQKPAVLTHPHEQNMTSSTVLRPDLILPASPELHRGGETPLFFPSPRPPTNSQKTLQSSQALQTRQTRPSARHKSKNQPHLHQCDDPLLPARGFTVQPRSSRGLLDEDDNGASAIPSLEPLRQS